MQTSLLLRKRFASDLNIAHSATVFSLAGSWVHGNQCCHVAIRTQRLLYEVSPAPNVKVASCLSRMKVPVAPRTFAFVDPGEDSRATAMEIKVISIWYGN